MSVCVWADGTTSDQYPPRLPELDNLKDGYWWAKTKNMGVWRMLRKSTDRQSWGLPWKDLEDGKRVAWSQIRDRYAEIVEVRHP